MPARLQQRLASMQASSRPLLSPQPPTDDGPEGLVEAGPLYAGETVGRISTLRGASELVAELAP
jgi:hypothetical protein